MPCFIGFDGGIQASLATYVDGRWKSVHYPNGVQTGGKQGRDSWRQWSPTDVGQASEPDRLPCSVEVRKRRLGSFMVSPLLSCHTQTQWHNCKELSNFFFFFGGLCSCASCARCASVMVLCHAWLNRQ